MTNKVIVEIDVDLLLSDKTRGDAFYKVLKDDLFNNRNMIDNIKGIVLDIFIKDVGYPAFESKIIEQIKDSIGTAEKIKEVVNWRTNTAQLVDHTLEKHKDILEKEVLQYIATTDFQKRIADMVEEKLTARVTNLITQNFNDD